MPVNLIDPATGEVHSVEESDPAFATLVREGWTPEGGAEAAARVTQEQREDEYSSAANKVRAGIAGIGRGASLGLTDVAASALGYGEDVANLREYNPGVSLAGEVLGGVSGMGLAGQAAKLGQGIAKVGEGASLASKVVRAGAGYGTDGALQGLGSGISELALSADPLTVESVVGTLGSHTLFGGAVGAGAGVLGKGLEVGLRKGAKALDAIAARGSKADEIGEVAADLAGMDAKALRGARKAELDAIEAARVPQRAQLSEEITAFRREMKEQKVWLATRGADEAELKAIGKRTLKADKQLDNLIDDPKYFAENPKGALSALRKQEAALDELVTKHGEKLRAKFANDTSGARLQALDNAAKALERNRSLQQKITDLAAAPSSSRLTAIDDAKELLVSGGAANKGQSLFDRVASGTAFTGVAGAISALPIPGAAAVAPFLGARAAELVTGKLGDVGKRFTQAGAAAAERMSKGITAFLDVTGKLPPIAPVLATKTLGALRYSGSRDDEKPAPKGKKAKPQKLADLYKARAAEVRSQVELAADPTTGQMKPRMRMDARAKMASTFAGIRVQAPLVADAMETLAARRLTFLAEKLPKRPEFNAIQTGPDMWQPSDFEMRTWARYAAAVEDPGAIAERLANGTITPEDAEVMQAVYPEQLAALTQQVLAQLPQLQKTLPYKRRLALSILTGVNVDPMMDPYVMSVLQQSYVEEPGSEGGTQAPQPQPQFGSVKVDEPTPAQQRSA